MIKVCPVCGTTFDGRPCKIYCSPNCQKKSTKKRNKAKASGEKYDLGSKICGQCGKEFVQRAPNQIYCCYQCAKDASREQQNKWARENRPARSCQWCGTSFVPEEGGSRKFCCSKCEEEYRAARVKPRPGKARILNKAERERQERAMLEAEARAHGMHYGTYTAFLRMKEQSRA